MTVDLVIDNVRGVPNDTVVWRSVWLHVLCKPEGNQYLEIICVKKRPWSMPVLRAVSSGLFVKHTSIWHSFSNTSVSFNCCLHQRTPFNSVQTLKLQWRRYVLVGFNRTDLIVLIISEITAGQSDVNSWSFMLLCFNSIESDFRIKTVMDLIALNKGLTAQSKEGISLRF